MKKLVVKQHAGSSVQTIEINGDPKHPEPQTLRVQLPFGEVEISRTSSNEYWIHISTEVIDGNGLKHNLGEIKSFRVDEENIIGEMGTNAVHGAMLLGKAKAEGELL